MGNYSEHLRFYGSLDSLGWFRGYLGAVDTHHTIPSDEVSPASGLQPDNVAAQVLELMAQDPGPDQGLPAYSIQSLLTFIFFLFQQNIAENREFKNGIHSYVLFNKIFWKLFNLEWNAFSTMMKKGCK